MKYCARTKILYFFLAFSFYLSAPQVHAELAETYEQPSTCLKDVDCKANLICSSNVCVKSGVAQKEKAKQSALSSAFKSENSEEKPVEILNSALRLDRNAENFIVKIESSLDKLVKSGAISVKPDLQYDYSKVYIVRKPLIIASSSVALLVYDKFESWIGCCVNPGFSIVMSLDGQEQNAEIFAYARLLNCSINEGISIIGHENLISTKNKSFITLGCGINDSFEVPSPSNQDDYSSTGQVDLQLIEASNLVVRLHPKLQGTLKMNAILHNRASFSQPFPLLELRLSDTQGKLLGSRRLKPSEYLGSELAGSQEMPPQMPISISVDILDPGPDAVNYNVIFFSPE